MNKPIKQPEPEKPSMKLPTEPGWYWVKNPHFGRNPTEEEWEIIYIKRMENDFLHLKAGQLVVGVNPLETFARSSRTDCFVKIEPPIPQ